VVKRSRIVRDQVLDELECTKLAQLGQHLAELHGCPQDIEWALDAGGSLYLLQSRPITTV
jgi:pyruvate, water dikinase